MKNSVNTFGNLKTRLAVGEICIGANITLDDPCATEIMCGAGYDYLVLDSEHGPLDRQTLQQHVMAATGTQTTPLVRVTWNHPGLVKQALDIGAGGVIVPLAKTVEDVRQAVAACLYPPQGTRGFGPRRASNYGRRIEDYTARANQDVNVWVQIEQIQAVEHIDEIVTVPGLTGLYVGRNDLSGSMGILGQINHSRVIEAVEKVIASASEAGVPVGMGGPTTLPEISTWIDKGLQFVTVGGDIAFLATMADRTFEEIQEVLQQRK